MLSDWTFYCAAIPAVIALGLARGGFNSVGALSTPLLALAPGLSPVTAAAILLPLLIFGDIVSVWNFRKEFSWPNLRVLLPASVIGIAIGWLAAGRLNEDVVRVLIGLISIGLVMFMLLKSRLNDLSVARPTKPAGIFWGSVAGFTSFVSHSGGPPFQVYVLPQRLAPNVFAGTATMFFAAVNAMKLVPYFLLGQFKTETLSVSAALAPVALAATFGGIWVVRRISVDRFYGIILALTFFFGAWLVVDGVRALAVTAH